MFEPLLFVNSIEWRLWLEAHTDAREIWLTIKKKQSKRLVIGYEEALEEALAHGWIDSKMKSVDADVFIQRFTPRRSNSPWSLKNKKIAERLISEGRMTQQGLDCIDTAKKNGRWDSAYTSKTPPKIPIFIEDALKMRGAWGRFNDLSNSARLQYVYWIEAAKRPETKMKRIVNTIERITK